MDAHLSGEDTALARAKFFTDELKCFHFYCSRCPFGARGGCGYKLIFVLTAACLDGLPVFLA